MNILRLRPHRVDAHAAARIKEEGRETDNGNAILPWDSILGPECFASCRSRYMTSTIRVVFDCDRYCQGNVNLPRVDIGSTYDG